MDLEIIDNFLPEKEFEYLQKIMLGINFPWFFSNFCLSPNDKNQFKFQFVHNIFRYDLGQCSNAYPLFNKCEKLLEVSKLVRIKANLNTRTVFKRKTGFHNDYANMKTSVFYLNTNNGGTKFKRGKFVRSVGNRMITFDSNYDHTGVTCTDQNNRVVVNFNYYD